MKLARQSSPCRSQSGSCSSSWVMSWASPPAADMVQMPQAPSRLLMNAICWPLGLHTGRPSRAWFSVSRLTAPSVTDMEYNSHVPSRESLMKTIDVPSGNQRGSESLKPSVNRLRLEPSALIVHRPQFCRYRRSP